MLEITWDIESEAQLQHDFAHGKHRIRLPVNAFGWGAGGVTAA
jgi:hypothetical protein